MAPRNDLRQRRGYDDVLDRRELLWSSASFVGLATVVLLASLTAVVTGYVISGQSTWNAQVPTMDVAIITLVVASAAEIGFLQSGRRTIGLRRRALLGEPAVQEAVRPLSFEALSINDSLYFVASPELKHYHLSSCPLAAGRGWPAELRAVHELHARTPCGVCRP